MSKKMKGNLLLLLTAFIWGSAFVAQKSGMEYIGPFTYNGIRTFIGGLVLIPVILVMSRHRTAKSQPAPETAPVAEADGAKGRRVEQGGTPTPSPQPAPAAPMQATSAPMTPTPDAPTPDTSAQSAPAKSDDRRTLLTGGLCSGIALFIASSLQQFGINYTTAGKAGFITTLYVVIVPIFSLFLRKKVRPIMWLCVGMGAVGLYLLCMTDASFSLQRGDMLVLLCAIVFAIHILIIDYFSPRTDGVKLSCIQFLTAGTLGLLCMLLFEDPDIHAILDCAVPILYGGVLSCGVAYTLQVVAQKDADPTAASLILSLESVFAVISGAILLHESMSARELVGCLIIFAAIIIAQLPSREERAAAKLPSGRK